MEQCRLEMLEMEMTCKFVLAYLHHTCKVAQSPGLCRKPSESTVILHVKAK